MAEVTWTYEARRWLQEIYDYIARDIPTPPIGPRFTKQQIVSLTFRRGFRYRDRQDLRILRTDRYRIAYRLTSPTEIDILGVFHVSLDIERYLA